MTPEEKQERKRLIMKRRLTAVGEAYELPPLDGRTLYKLSEACAAILGDEGIPDVDLRVIHKLASRGFFKSF